MKKISTLLLSLLLPLALLAQGWPQNYGGVMLQGFYWDSYDDTQWTVLESQADELAQSFALIWVPQSGNCGGTSMGYDDLYWFQDYNSSFGTEQQLRQMIQTFRSKGLGTIADVVINHRKNVSNWVDFPRETYKGVTYEMLSTDICANDDGGKTKTWATQNGYQLSANNDTGEAWDGMRDLDHKSENVQTIVKAYLDLLKNDLGYAGFRYDMVKGYAATYTGLYNQASQPEYSVGEYWDGNAQMVKNWLNGTKVDGQIMSAAFDFPFRYTVRDAVNSNDWRKLANTSLISDGAYRRYAVTFVENHDTELRSNGETQDPLRRDTLAANAFLLAMPGTPCVFLKHWQAYPTEIKAMIAARQAAGITSESSYANVASQPTYFANAVNDRLLVVAGIKSQYKPSASEWVRILDGHHYSYYLSTQMQTAWASLASSVYYGEQQTTLTAVTAEQGARLVYTLDGTEPTAQSSTADSGTTLTIPLGTTTLRVGLLVNGVVKGLITRTYTVKEQPVTPEVAVPSFCTVAEGEMCAFFEAPATWQGNILCWAWNNSTNFTGGTWPGAGCTLLGQSASGLNVWKWSYGDMPATLPTGIIFSSDGKPQTGDFPFQNGGYYNASGLQANVLGIGRPAFAQQREVRVYAPDGRFVGRIPMQDLRSLKRGLYIMEGKKVAITQ